MIDNKTFAKLAAEYGTPLYVYDADTLKDRYTGLYSYIPYPKLKIHYAMKANYNPGVLKFFKKLGARIDTVSPAEILLAQRCGFTKDEIIFTANNFTDSDMQKAAGLGTLFNIGSVSELKRYAAKHAGTEVCFRFNPEVVAGENVKVQTGGDLAKFGILFDDLQEVLKIVKTANLKVVGIHQHTGSGIKDTAKYLQAVDNLLKIATPENFPHLRFVDLGGGIYVPYKPEDKAVDLESFGQEIIKRVQVVNQRFNRELEVYFEPGKYLVTESGSLLIRINTIKDNHGHVIAGSDSGFNHLIRPILYDAYHQIENLTNPNGAISAFSIAGNICEGGDLFAKSRELPEVREGDLLRIKHAGAYGYVMGSVYNLRPLPTEILVENGKVIAKRERLSDDQLVSQILAECE